MLDNDAVPELAPEVSLLEGSNVSDAVLLD